MRYLQTDKTTALVHQAINAAIDLRCADRLQAFSLQLLSRKPLITFGIVMNWQLLFTVSGYRNS